MQFTGFNTVLIMAQHEVKINVEALTTEEVITALRYRFRRLGLKVATSLLNAGELKPTPDEIKLQDAIEMVIGNLRNQD